MTSPLSNTLPFHYTPVSKATSSNHQLEALFIDESCGDNMQTRKWEVVQGLYKRSCRFFPEWRISKKDLLVKATGCLVLVTLITLAARSNYLNSTTNNDMAEFIKSQAEEITQKVTEFIQKEEKKGIQLWTERIKHLSLPEEKRQHLLGNVTMTMQNRIEKDLQLYGGNLDNQTEKIVQIFTDPNLWKRDGGFWFTGVTCIIVAISHTVTTALQLYFLATPRVKPRKSISLLEI